MNSPSSPTIAEGTPRLDAALGPLRTSAARPSAAFPVLSTPLPPCVYPGTRPHAEAEPLPVLLDDELGAPVVEPSEAWEVETAAAPSLHAEPPDEATKEVPRPEAAWEEEVEEDALPPEVGPEWEGDATEEPRPEGEPVLEEAAAEAPEPEAEPVEEVAAGEVSSPGVDSAWDEETTSAPLLGIEPAWEEEPSPDAEVAPDETPAEPTPDSIAPLPWEEELVLDADWALAAEDEDDLPPEPTPDETPEHVVADSLGLVSGPDLYSPRSAEPVPPEPARSVEPSRETAAAPLDEPLFDHVADRLERIARSLRDRSSAEALSAEAETDPLQVLITGYALGYSEAMRRARERERERGGGG